MFSRELCGVALNLSGCAVSLSKGKQNVLIFLYGRSTIYIDSLKQHANHSAVLQPNDQSFNIKHQAIDQEGLNMKKAFNGFVFFMLALLGSLTGRFIRVYTDYKANPWKYTPPYETWQEELKLDFIVFGSAIIICILVMIVLKVLIKKREKQDLQEKTDA